MVGIKIGMNGFQKAEYSSMWIPVCRNKDNFKKPIKSSMQRGRCEGLPRERRLLGCSRKTLKWKQKRTNRRHLEMEMVAAPVRHLRPPRKKRARVDPIVENEETSRYPTLILSSSLPLVTTSLFSLEKEMATHSSVLAWRIPGMGEPGGLPFVGSHRVGHDWSDLAAAAAVCSLYLWACIFTNYCCCCLFRYILKYGISGSYGSLGLPWWLKW